MTLPFSRAEFFSVFAGYNESVWPAQVVLYALAIVAVVLTLRRSANAGRVTHAVLAVLWLWMGLVYHAVFFADINPAALFFALFFVVQSVAFAVLAARPKAAVFVPRRDLDGWAGGGLVALGLLIYPILSIAAGHQYPAQPTFGLPCPTTIFTLGILLWARGTVPRVVFVIPILWAAIGTVGAIQLGVIEDLSLTFSLAVIALVLVAPTAAFHTATLRSRLGSVRWS
jgi:hypothetical protein